MKNRLGILLMIVLASACNMQGLKNQLQDVAELQKKFPADNISIGTTVSTDWPQGRTNVTVTNLHDCIYSTLSPELQTLCVALEYFRNLPDSAREDLDVNVKMETAKKDGLITTTNSQSFEYTGAELQKIDSLYMRTVEMLDVARANQSFVGLHEYVDSTSLPDSIFTGVDTISVVLFSTLSQPEYTFYGSAIMELDGTSESVPVIWIYVHNDTKYDVLRCVFDSEGKRMIGLSVNPDE